MDAVWCDCPICGAKDSVHYLKDIVESITPLGLEPLTISGLSGYFCDLCNDGFYDSKSIKIREKALVQAKLKHELIKQFPGYGEMLAKSNKYYDLVSEQAPPQFKAAYAMHRAIEQWYREQYGDKFGIDPNEL